MSDSDADVYLVIYLVQPSLVLGGVCRSAGVALIQNDFKCEFV